MSVSELQQQLSTPEGFRKAVKHKSAVFATAVGFLVVGVGCLVFNLLEMGSASDWDWKWIERYFLTPEAVQFTGRRAARGELLRYLWVWGPFILLPIGLILLIVWFATRNKNGASLYADYVARGWVGRQLSTGITIPQGRTQIHTVFISHPSIPDDQFEQIAAQHAAQIAGLDKKTRKSVVNTATRAGIMRGASATALSPQLPAAITMAPTQGKGPYVVVIPPVQQGGKFQLAPVKA